MLQQSSSSPWTDGAPQVGLLAATVQCDSLMAAIAAVEQAMEHQAPLVQTLRGSMGTVRANLQQHVHRSESPGGLLPSLALDGPRFARRAENLRCEHDQLQLQFDLLAASLTAGVNEQTVRLQAAALLRQLRDHLNHSSRLIFDAYLRDVGAGD